MNFLLFGSGAWPAAAEATETFVLIKIQRLSLQFFFCWRNWNLRTPIRMENIYSGGIPSL
jgi:hypothetical protein